MKNLFFYLVIWAISLNPGFSQTVSTYASGVFGAVGIELDGRGWIWVAQVGTGNNDARISIVTGQNQVYPFMTGLPSEMIPSGDITGSEHVFFSPAGKLLIMQGGPGTDSLSQSILVVDTTGFVPGTSPPLNRSAIEAVYKVGEFLLSVGDSLSNPYTLAFGPHNDMYIADAAANALVKRDNATGHFSLFATFPHIPNTTGIGGPFSDAVPTGIVFKDNKFFVGSLTGFPFGNAAARVYAVDTMGSVSNYLTGLTTIVDVTTDPNDSLVVLQHAAFQPPPPFVPNSGAVLRIRNGSIDTIASGLNRPTSVRFKSSDEVFVSTLTDGKILRVVKDEIPTKGLLLWLKADAGVDTLNGRVSRWHDQSGNGNDAIESHPNRQPSLVNTVLNGKPVLRFDGVDDRLGYTGSKKMNQISLFTVFKNKSGAVGNFGGFVSIFGPAGSRDANQHYWFHMRDIALNDNNTIIISTKVDPSSHIDAIAPNIAAFDEWRNINIVTDSTVLNTTLRWNGKDASMVPFGQDYRISAQLGDSTGSGGGMGSTDNFFDLSPIVAKCDIAELIVYDTVLTHTERLAIEKYLNDKYQVVAGVNDSRNTNIPEQFTLYQNYPNPFNPSTTIRYALPQRSHATLSVFNTLGQHVVELVNGDVDAGNHEVKFDGSALASGVYFYRLQAGSYVQTKKLMLLR